MKSTMLRRQLAGALLGTAALLSTTGVQAACTQADLTGTWYSMGLAGDLFDGSLDELDRCKIVLGSTGSIVTSRSSCLLRRSAGQYTVGISAGALSVSSSCAVTGSMRLCNSGACITWRIQNAQLARDKNILPMVGYLASEPAVVFSYTLVKQ